MNETIDISYTNYLLNLLANSANIDELNSELKLNIYLTLIALSNSYYSEEKYQENLLTIEDFLRKTNNLKVKIQLKRKPVEIDNLLKEIKEIYEKNTNLINKFNYDNLNIIDTLDSKDAKELTTLIDRLTKEKIHYHDNKDMFDNLRSKILDNIFTSNYFIKDNNKLYIKLKDNNDLVVSLDMFYQIFDYLLDIDNYPQPLLNNQSNRMHTILTANTIKVLIDKQFEDKSILIPIVLTNLINMNIDNPNNLDFSSFTINNIKITDLYKLAENNQLVDGNKSAKWQKVIIPNDYLLDRIKDISKDGTYYIKDDIFYLEKIANKTSDFKISISIDNMLNFLKSYLLTFENKTTYNK